MIATTRVEVALGGTVADVALTEPTLVGVVSTGTVGVTGVDVFVGVCHRCRNSCRVKLLAVCRA